MKRERLTSRSLIWLKRENHRKSNMYICGGHKVSAFLRMIMKEFFASLFIFMSLGAAVEAPKIVEVTKFINHTAKEIKRNKEAVLKIRETVAGQCFQKAVLEKKFIQTNNKSNQEVLSILQNASVDIELEMYRSWKRTVGYTYSSSKRIWMNRKYHDYMGACDVSANMIHEIMHKLKFGHDVNPSKARANSVPYAIGSIMEKCCK